ncbi:G-type lectin S-receptor-like serine/threonine-protein kinase At2g19130 [Dioscorea cayenensis subsp. rotundata]|uniref:Receptor-like serine/threonine-protein kinase n=1 Tax=Dioscorea cayennensis subsp. rotundata TaxID=55577 RepID=A0AB40CML9_DIOCR|nr:G-type lectin S-receptor-like serine/threonine-protein kinase At2g19130 [Dioscorea cayenensis subsp. rotundata]
MITISPGQGLSGNQTLVSKGGNFELGFFSPGNSHKYYIGIWYKKIPQKDVIWVGNRINPISNPSTSLLKLSNNGNLVLFNQSGSPVWSSNSTVSTSNSTFAELLDNGNLVIRNNSNFSTPIWQTFEHPSHTWMPGAPLGVNKLTGEFQALTSWKSSEDPSPGLFSLSLALNRSSQLVELYNSSLIYASTGVWNGQFFNSLEKVFMEKNIFNFSFVDNEEQKYATYIVDDPSMIIYILMDPSGQVKQFSWLSDKKEWLLNCNQPPALCDVYSACGAFGVCHQRTSLYCSCFVGYQPVSNKEWDLGAWSSGCSRKTSFQCNDKNNISTGDGFLEMSMVRLPSNPQNLAAAQSAEECEQACRKQCSCTAYAFDGQCSIWNGDLHNVKQLHDGLAGTLYLRLAASDIPSPFPTNSQAELEPEFIFTGVAGLIVLVSFLVFVGLIWVHRKRPSARIAMQLAEGSLIPFTYSDLQRMTKNFSDILGRGGFGSVFKGALPDSTTIAVKKLEGWRQGEKQFRTEVITLGSLQHVNLVRLRGFCCEANKRLLAYDYMAGGSLDTHLFRSSKVLDWETRFEIILGVARALAYLHENCRECIIHCDIKPENILLDNELKPKVADFGMAKLIGRDFSRVLTTTRGTLGYLAPEWLLGLPISSKVDVYSFGMMLFELISGGRNSNQSEINENIDYFPFRVACQLIEGDDNHIGDLLDKRLQGEANLVQVKRICTVACWCIQDWEVDRPSMGHVLRILEGAVDATTPPVPRLLLHLAES